MQFKVHLTSLDTVAKDIPLEPGVYLITSKIDLDIQNSEGAESSSVSGYIGDDQTIAGASLNADPAENKTSSSFVFAQLATVTDAKCKVRLMGPGLESGATSASATFYICAERVGH